MQGGKPLRLYANPAKVWLYLLGSAAFVFAGEFIFHHPTANTSALTIAVAWVAIVFFGIGMAIFLLMFIRDVVLRRAILRIDEQGWTYLATLFLRKQMASWQDIEHIGIYRQWMGESRFRRRARYTYWLIAHGTDLRKVARVTRDPFSARFYPALRGALIAVPLNMLFIRVAPQKLDRMLARIRAERAFEMQFYNVHERSCTHRYPRPLARAKSIANLPLIFTGSAKRTLSEERKLRIARWCYAIESEGMDRRL